MSKLADLGRWPMTEAMSQKPLCDVALPAACGDEAAIGALIIDRVSHRYEIEGGVPVVTLDNVSIEVAPHEFVSLVGQSGCGKSTLLNILVGLVAPVSGQVSLTTDGTANASGLIGFVPQEDRLLPWRSVLSNIEYPLEIQGALSARARRELALDRLARVGLSHARSYYPHQLSGGMRQRVSIARALTTDPRVLLLDEPFGALDAWTRNALHEVLLAIKEIQGFSVVLVTHDVREALMLSDTIVTLKPSPGRVHKVYRLPRGPTPRPYAALHQDYLSDISRHIHEDLGLALQ